MGLSEFTRLIALMVRLARGMEGSFSYPAVTRYQGHTAAHPPTVFDVYGHKRKKRSTWVLVHGFTVNGRKDHRLVRFSHLLAQSGVICVVPTLEGLASCRWEPGDLDALARVIAAASNENQGPVGLMGFSYGGSYCLLAAARQGIKEYVHRVISFGAYHSIRTLFDEYTKIPDREPQHTCAGAWDAVIYCRLALLHGYGGEKFFPPGVQEQIKAMLTRYCTNASLEEKKKFYHQYLREPDMAEIIRCAMKPDVVRELSPEGNISGLACPVTLIHQRNDPVIPQAHAEHLYKELLLLANPERHRLIITSLLSHVSPSNIWHIRDAVRFSLAMAPILQV
jgi:pimeloyl-ACP methyl ester carboxylesterase